MSDLGEKEKGHIPSEQVQQNGSPPSLVGSKSPGVVRIEALAAHISLFDRLAIFISIFLVAYAYGLDATLRYAYQPFATSSFQSHSLLSTINVVRAVVAAAAQPTAAKIADVFGRVELIAVSAFFYIIGTIVEATSNDVGSFAAGAFLYQVGYTMIVLLVEVVIADITSLRSRLFFSYLPTAPFIINTWVSGIVSAASLRNTSWRWGIGMWCIIYPICSLPLLISLWWVGHKAKSAGSLGSYKTPYQAYGGMKLAHALFWQLDVPGIILLIMVFGFILTPLSLAQGMALQWRQAKIIAPLVIGTLSVPVWVWWEKKAPHPMVPFHLMKDRAVWGALGIAITLNFAWTCQSDFLFTVLIVAFNESVKSATRITAIYSFSSVVTGILLGIVVFLNRRLKVFILFGTCLFMVAFGLLINYRGGTGRSAHNGLILAQILLGIAGGFFPYPAQVSIQAAVKHEHLAVVTGIYLASYNIGSALGNAVSGAIWRNVVPGKLNSRIANSTQAARWFSEPLLLVPYHPPGTPDRDAAIVVYKDVQRLLCITGICLCVVLVFFACVIRNTKLGPEQSAPDAEERAKTPEAQNSEEVKSKFAFWRR